MLDFLVEQKFWKLFRAAPAGRSIWTTIRSSRALLKMRIETQYLEKVLARR